MYSLIKKVMVLFWILLAFFSLLHLLSISDLFDVSNVTAGYLAWCTFLTSIIVLGWNQLRKIFFIFCFFSLLGCLTGSYLEPPADPLDHLRESYQRCEKKVSDVDTTNRGLWQYGMNATILCRELQADSPSSYLQRVDLLNGIYYGLGAVILFLVAKSAGFADRWAIMSIVTAMLFFGTNVFSYFRYYSYAPSFSSLCIYWLWIARFFFTRGWKNLILGFFASVIALPILMVNHLQETIFLLFVTVFWMCILLTEIFILSNVERKYEKIAFNEKVKRKTIIICCVISFLVLFVAPQSAVFQEILSSFFIHDFWKQNQDVVLSINGWHLTGKIWEFKYRIIDTLGFAGFAPLLLAPFFLFKVEGLPVAKNRGRILVLGLIPFLIYCIPLFNFIWLSNCIRTPTHLRYYYRFCFAALSWLPIIYLIAILDLRLLQSAIVNVSSKSKKYFHVSVVIVVFSVLLWGSSMRVFPFFGKLAFLIQDSKPWWPQWSPMVEKLLDSGKKEVLTDPLTGMVVAGVFGKYSVLSSRNITNQVLFVEEMDELGESKKQVFAAPLILLLDDTPLEARRNLQKLFIKLTITGRTDQNSRRFDFSEKVADRHCLVNLRGFSPSWIPFETGHWNPRITNTKWFYRYHYKSVADLEKELRLYPPRNCIVLY